MHIHDSSTRQPIWLVEHMMSEQLQTAVETLASTFQSLDLVARALPVNAKEVAEALAACKEKDTAEYVALVALSKYNPYTPPAKK